MAENTKFVIESDRNHTLRSTGMPASCHFSFVLSQTQYQICLMNYVVTVHSFEFIDIDIVFSI